MSIPTCGWPLQWAETAGTAWRTGRFIRPRHRPPRTLPRWSV